MWVGGLELKELSQIQWKFIMEEKFKWLYKKTPRSVSNLRLWGENPRLNPLEDHIHISDFADDFTSPKAEKDSFFELIDSIVEKGFVPFDPVIVWKHEENGRYYVAEGNRRVLALKLILEPEKGPRWMRSYLFKKSGQIDHSRLEKIMVNVAPTFEDAEWYISQRNNTASLQRRWSRIQQLRWISTLYEKYHGDMETIKSKTNLTQGELDSYVRLLKIQDLVHEDQVKGSLSPEVYEKAASYRFPISIIERFFSSKKVKEAWGVEFDGTDLKINSNKSSFLNAYSELIKQIVEDEGEKIDTRTITSHIDEILISLPNVSFEPDDSKKEDDKSTVIEDTATTTPPIVSKEEDINTPKVSDIGNPKRRYMIPSEYVLLTGSFRLQKQFSELKIIPYSKYQSSIAAALRVFLDLAVLNYIETEKLESDLKKYHKKDLRSITLHQRLEYIKQEKLSGGTKAYKNLEKLLNPTNEYSLDVLNGYVHSPDGHYFSKEFLNGFWDFLFPLFQKLLEIKEK